jgi:hypothetical protein
MNAPQNAPQIYKAFNQLRFHVGRGEPQVFGDARIAGIGLRQVAKGCLLCIAWDVFQLGLNVVPPSWIRRKTTQLQAIAD